MKETSFRVSVCWECPSELARRFPAIGIDQWNRIDAVLTCWSGVEAGRWESKVSERKCLKMN